MTHARTHAVTHTLTLDHAHTHTITHTLFYAYAGFLKYPVIITRMSGATISNIDADSVVFNKNEFIA